jgi:hypothetical protein
LDPTWLELIMAVMCTAIMVLNIYFKSETKTLIFMFNPCHLVNLCLAIVGFSRFSVSTEMMSLFIFSSAFGGWIGLIFSENVELTPLELIVYYGVHFFTSFGGPLVLCISGRFDPLSYIQRGFIDAGFDMFCLYMRVVLTPLSLLTWANLNHSLCGVDNDPFYSYFEMGKWYYFWADLYLLFSCYVGIFLNAAICYVIKVIILQTVCGCCIDKDTQQVDSTSGKASKGTTKAKSKARMDKIE